MGYYFQYWTKIKLPQNRCSVGMVCRQRWAMRVFTSFLLFCIEKQVNGCNFCHNCPKNFDFSSIFLANICSWGGWNNSNPRRNNSPRRNSSPRSREVEIIVAHGLLFLKIRYTINLTFLWTNIGIQKWKIQTFYVETFIKSPVFPAFLSAKFIYNSRINDARCSTYHKKHWNTKTNMIPHLLGKRMHWREIYKKPNASFFEQFTSIYSILLCFLCEFPIRRYVFPNKCGIIL